MLHPAIDSPCSDRQQLMPVKNCAKTTCSARCCDLVGPAENQLEISWKSAGAFLKHCQHAFRQILQFPILRWLAVDWSSYLLVTLTGKRDGTNDPCCLVASQGLAWVAQPLPSLEHLYWFTSLGHQPVNFNARIRLLGGSHDLPQHSKAGSAQRIESYNLSKRQSVKERLKAGITDVYCPTPVPERTVGPG